MLRPALAALLLALVVVGCGVAGSAKIDAPVTVYVSLPLTGPRAVEGQDAADGARLALEEAGGKAGSIEIQARYLDDAKGQPWDPVAVGANAREAVQDSSAAAYIGELDSEPTRASVPITNDAGMVQVSPGAGAVDLTTPAAGYPDSPDRYRPSGRPNLARVVPSDEIVVDAAASLASERGVTRAAVASDGSPFEDLVASEFRSAATERGVQVVESGPASRYEPVAQRIRIDGQFYELSAELDPRQLPDKAFADRFAARFKRAPGPYAAYGYEALALALSAIEGAGTDASSFRDNVREHVFGAQRNDTVLGSYSITDQGDTTECMIQRYRDEGGARTPLGAPCPTR
jgi:branched-chain amino acid transport system substrate-binding protein